MSQAECTGHNFAAEARLTRLLSAADCCVAELLNVALQNATSTPAVTPLKLWPLAYVTVRRSNQTHLRWSRTSDMEMLSYSLGRQPVL